MSKDTLVMKLHILLGSPVGSPILTSLGNGRACAILLAEAGASVVCVDLDEEAAKRTAAIIEEEGHGQAIAVKADVTDEVQCREAVQKTMSQFNSVDILVNIVGIMGAKGTAVEVDMAEWAKSMEINVASMVMVRCSTGRVSCVH